MKKKKKSLSFLIIIKGILVVLSSISFSFFILKLEGKFTFLKIFPFVIIFILFWLGFSYIASKLNKEKFLSLLNKDANSFFILFLLPLGFLFEKTNLPNIILYKLFFFIIIISIAFSIKASNIKPFQIKEKYIYLFLGISIILYVSSYSFISFLNYKNLSILKIGDFTFFNQLFWYTINGKPLDSQVLGYNFLGEHFSPIIITIAPFYWLLESPLTLLICQTLIIAIGAIPVYMIAKDKLKNSFLSLSFSIAYLLYPKTGMVNLLEFHETPFCMPLLLFTFYFLEKRSYKLYFLFLFLSLMVKENISIIISLLGIYILFLKKEKKIGLLTFIIGLSWAYLSVKVAIPCIRETTSIGKFSGYAHLGKYSALGKSFSEILINLTFHPQKIISSLSFDTKLIMLNNFFYLLIPLGFLSFLSILSILAIPEFFLQSLSSVGLQSLLVSAYPSPIISILLVSSIYGIAHIKKIFPYIKFRFSIYLLSFSLLSNYYFGFSALKLPTDVVNYEFIHHKTILSLSRNIFTYKIPEETKILFKIKNLIPQEFSIASSVVEGPYLSSRKTIIPPSESQKADSVILNLNPTTWADMELINKTLEMTSKDKNFKLIFDKKGFYWFIRKEKVKKFLFFIKTKVSDDFISYFILSSIYYNLRNLDNAIIYAKKAIGKSKDKEDITNLHYDLAKYYYEKKELLKTIYHLENVVKLNPNHKQALENLKNLKKILDKNFSK